MKSRTLSVSIGLLLLLGGCSMHAEFHAGTRSGGSSSGGEKPQPAPQAQAPEREPQHEHEHDHQHEHEQEHGRGETVRVTRPQSSGDQQADTGNPAAPRDAKPAASSSEPPRRVGKPAGGAGSWSSVSTPRESAPTVQPPAEGAGAGWSGVGAAADRPAGSAGEDGASGGAGSGGGSSGSPDASAGKDSNKREAEPHYSRRRPRKKADKESGKADVTDDKQQVEQAPAAPKRER